MSCSHLHSSNILFHAHSFLIACGVSGPWILVFHEVGRNLTTFEFDELAEDVGNGIILRVAGGDDNTLNSGWCERRHVLSKGSGDAVLRNVKVPYMHL